MTTTTLREADLDHAILIPAGRLARGPSRARGPSVDREALERALLATVEGEVRFDGGSRAIYAHDASNYRRVPLGVVIPQTKEDIIAAIAACRQHDAAIVSRGGGTALAGQTVGEAVVFDFSKRMNRILEIDPVRKRARVELGVVCDELVDAAQPHGITWGPKPATHDRCCFGGMISNNCGGMHAQMNGIAVHNVEALEVVLYDGTRMSLGWMTEADLERAIAKGDAQGVIYGKLRQLRDRYADRIRSGYPKLPRRVSGYNLDQLLPGEDGRFNMARVVVGSEGTLVTMLEATLELIDDPPCRAAIVLGYRTIAEAADAVTKFLRFSPLSLEGMDDVLYGLIEKKGGLHAEHLKLLSEGSAWLEIEVGGASREEVSALADAVVAEAGDGILGSRIYLERAEQKKLWDAREGALGATAFAKDEPDSWPGWEDSAVPPERLGDYLRDLRKLYDRYDYHPALYGHFGMGLVHCRVPFDLYNEPGVRKYERFMDDAAELVVSYGGSLSGEHGDGQARGALLVKMFGPELMTAMQELKAIFDPLGRMNPGKIVDAYPITESLSFWPMVESMNVDTHFRFPEDGGSFARATSRCVGVGKCRRKAGEGEHDVMCPSYMVTHEERHSTRGRAHLLEEMMRSDGPVTNGWRDESVKEALDLCLACKGCKGECPVNVDVATFKAEFLSHYYEGRVRPRHAYAFGLIDRWSRFGEKMPGAANLVTQLPGSRAFAKLAAGVAQDARIPPFAPETFRAWFARRAVPEHASPRPKVVLWPDTFNDHFHPDTAKAAVRVLEAAGYQVLVPQKPMCCGRPLYDFGMLDTARSYLEGVLDGMKPYLEAELPVVVLEPSCASVFKDELGNMLPERADGKVLRERTMLLSELLVKEAMHFTMPRLERRAIVQGHCHHKSLLDFESEKRALAAMGMGAEVLEAGCCGMAGAFGFVNETRDVGIACGERALLPRVRAESEHSFVIANGFSCREQIAQHTERRALHFAEVVDIALQHSPHGLPDRRPEAAIVAERARLVRGSMVRAAVTIGALAAGAALAVTLARRWRKRR